VPRLEVGRVAKAHGLRGEVLVVPITNQPDRFVAGLELWRGDQPLVIESVRPQRDAYLVKFGGYDDRDAAETLRGATLTADALDAAPAESLWVHELIGADVFDRSGRALGRVVAVEANPAHDLLVLDSNVLVPMVFVVEHEPGKRVVVDPPDGLLEL
jgi:16S rRNA processing protein RimM